MPRHGANDSSESGEEPQGELLPKSPPRRNPSRKPVSKGKVLAQSSSSSIEEKGHYQEEVASAYDSETDIESPSSDADLISNLVLID